MAAPIPSKNENSIKNQYSCDLLSAKFKVTFSVVGIILGAFLYSYGCGCVAHQLAGTAKHKITFLIVDIDLRRLLLGGGNHALLSDQ